MSAMMNPNSRKTLFDIVYFSGLNSVLHPLCGGVGAILSFHHVRPRSNESFQPNAKLEIEPEFLRELIIKLRRIGYQLVSLDEAHRRLTGEESMKPFICFTFDDGYRDNFQFAYPILNGLSVPFAIFVVSGFADGSACLWWRVLERVIAQSDELQWPESRERVSCVTTAEKHAVFNRCAEWARLNDPGRAEHYLGVLCERSGVNMSALTSELCMSWSELARLARDPLVTLGGHGVTHIALSKAVGERAREEMEECTRLIERNVGVRCRHFAYPFGNRREAGPREFAIAAELGYKTALTTREGAIFREHRRHLTALPRICVDGDLQRWRYAEVMVSGVVRRVWNGGRCVDAA